MKTKIIPILLLALATVINVNGQNDTTTNTGITNLRFSDEHNFGLIPDYVEFQKRGYPKMDTLIKKEQILSNGTLRMILPKGTYDISVIAKDHESVFTDIEVINNTGEREIRFFPKSLKRPITYEQMKPLLKDDTVLMNSYVIDDSTRRPLAGVLIYTEDRAAQGLSDTNGHYQFYVPLPANDGEIKGRNAIYFEKENYITEVIYDFDMWSKQIYGRSCYMKKGTGIHKTDEMAGSRRGATIFTQEKEKENRESALGSQYKLALAPLRCARWMLEHHPDGSKQTEAEIIAVEKINKAIDEIRKAGLDDGRDVNWHPKVEEPVDHLKRVRAAIDYLHKAHEDVNKDKDIIFAKKIKQQVLHQIDKAIMVAENSIKQ